jgi:predicted MFS family arabinose efflux permease
VNSASPKSARGGAVTIWQSRRESHRRYLVPSHGHNLLPIYAMSFAMQCARSMYIVLISWLALEITNEISAVGRVLVFWQLLGFTVGPLIGPFVDRFRRRTIFMVGESAHGAGIALLALLMLVALAEPPGIHVLYATACLVSVGSLLSVPAVQALIQLTGGGILMRAISLGIFSGQIGNIVGAITGGLCLKLFGMTASLAVCAGFSFAAAALATLLRTDERCSERRTERHTHLSDLAGGFKEIARNPDILLAAFAILVAFSSSHATNALLAGFARYELELSPDRYGWIAMMYSGGGLLGSITLACFSMGVQKRFLLCFGSALLAVATAGFSTASTLSQAMFWQGLVGLSFTALRVGGDATILQCVPNAMVGRVRSNIEGAVGLMAIAIYCLPSLLAGVAIREIYMGFAGAFAISACIIVRAQQRIWAAANSVKIAPR